jgi:hypothetical protein
MEQRPSKRHSGRALALTGRSSIPTGAGLRGLASTSLIQPWRGRALAEQSTLDGIAIRAGAFRGG